MQPLSGTLQPRVRGRPSLRCRAPTVISSSEPTWANRFRIRQDLIFEDALELGPAAQNVEPLAAEEGAHPSRRAQKRHLKQIYEIHFESIHVQSILNPCSSVFDTEMSFSEVFHRCAARCLDAILPFHPGAHHGDVLTGREVLLKRPAMNI